MAWKPIMSLEIVVNRETIFIVMFMLIAKPLVIKIYTELRET